MTRKAWLAAAAVAVLAVTTLAGVPTAGAAGPTITATPSTDLIDGQVVTVVVTGLTPDTFGGVALCASGFGYDGCDPAGLLLRNTDGSGGFTTDYGVRTILHTPAGTFDCRQPASACILAANTNYTTEGAATTPVTFDPDGPLLPAPSITVTPSTGLIDRQAVAIHGEDFRPNSAISVRQCVAGATEVGRCRSNFSVPTFEAGPDGTVDLSFGVRAILHTDDGTTTDCRSAVDACELRVGPYDPIAEHATAAISFDPDAPLAPLPTVVATPSTDLVDGQTVTVDGAGFMPSSLVGLSECAESATTITCRSGVVATTDTAGAFSLPKSVRTQLWSGEILDCRDATVTCTFQAYGFDEPDDVAEATLTFDPDGPLLPPPTLVATPSAELVDGQTISLTGSGYDEPFPIFIADHAVHAPSARWVPPSWPPAEVTADDTISYPMTIVQCLAGTTDSSSCSQFYNDGVVDGEGDLTGSMPVWATFTTNAGDQVDCRVQACELRTGYTDPLSTGVTPITFDPDAPLAPAPTVTVTPTTGLTNGAAMHVVGDGFPAFATITFHQCRSDQTDLAGCDTDLVGIASADQNGHVDATTAAKQVLSLGTNGVPDSVTYDCASAVDGCRLLMSNAFGPAKWNQVTLDYVGSSTAPAVAPASPASEVVVEAAFTG